MQSSSSALILIELSEHAWCFKQPREIRPPHCCVQLRGIQAGWKAYSIGRP
ncbi:Serine-pyruvate aminotransferase [Sesbania bispinosa]|nr:Serine-pyruvate aminotransferase [Sesbania bispinosa]